MFFHIYVRWSYLVPYGSQYENVPVFKYGWIGVELFFLVSGFVILMTLEKCNSSPEFLKRRWLRLFPGMLFCSMLIFFTAPLLPERPAGEPNALSLLPGMLFIEPKWLGRLLDVKIIELEGAFWSLFVEFKFYIFASFSYFWRGRTGMIASLLVAFLIGQIGSFLPKDSYHYVVGLINQTSFIYFGWFASGAAFYVYVKERKEAWFTFALAVAIVCSLTIRRDVGAVISASLISLLFACSVRYEWIQRIIGNKFLLFFGFISYPFYLLHENAIISGIVKIHNLAPNFPIMLIPLPPILVVTFTSLLIVKWIEPCIKSIISRLV